MTFSDVTEMQSQHDLLRSKFCRIVDGGYAMEHVTKDIDLLVPAPARISFPWEEPNNSLDAQLAGRNFGLGSLSDNEPMGCTVGITSEPQRERRRWARPRIVEAISNNSGNSREDKGEQYETEEKYVTSRDCSKDSDSQGMIAPCNISENKCHGVLVSKSVIFRNEPYVTEKHPTLFEVSDKNRSLDDHIPDNITESPIAARIPSPSSASSITSGKRLEWDSGADVGYNFIEDSNVNTRANLSTIERIALARGCSAAFVRLDPEGTSGPYKPKLGTQNSSLSFNSPIAKSTPILKDESKVNPRITHEDTVVEPIETVLPGGYLYLHSGEEFESEAPPQNLSAECSKSNSAAEDKISDSETIHKKHSNSLINLSFSSEEVQSAVPRSQSYLNLLGKEDDHLLQTNGTLQTFQQRCTLAAACSVSSSSVATIVQKPVFPKTSDKFIQTLPLKLSIGVQTSDNTEISPMSQGQPEVKSSVPNSAVGENKKESIICSHIVQSHKCNGAHKKGYIVSNNSLPCTLQNSMVQVEQMINCSQKEIPNTTSRIPEKESSTLESATSSGHTAGSSCVAETSCSGAGMPAEEPRGSTGIVGSANSFEYLPGDVFEDTFKNQKKSVPPTSSETSTNQIHSDEGISAQNNGLCKQTKQTSCSRSLTKDIEEGVELLQKLMSEKSFNGQMKKKVIRQIVNKLVNSDYAEDLIDNEVSQRVPLSCNVPWVPAAPNSQTVNNVDLHSNFGSGDSNQRNSLLIPASSVHSSGGRPKRRLVCSDTRTTSSSCTPSGSVSVPGDNEESQAESSEISSNAISKHTKRDWTLPTTRSEKAFEEKREMTEKNTSSTPPLLRLCKTEHEKQLQWIRFEIDHLTHLKQLLEKQEVVTRTLSNLAAHEHKFHKIQQVDRSTSPNSNYPRFKMKTAGNWSNSTEYSLPKNDSTLSNSIASSKISTNAGYQEPSSSGFSVRSRFQEACIPHIRKKETLIRYIANKHDLSTQTPTLDSYTLCNIRGAGSNTKRPLTQSYCSKNEVGSLNVYVQTSPKPVKNQDNCYVPDYASASEKASKSHESAVKCCCKCKRALEEIVNMHTEYSKKEEDVNIYCKCNPANVKSPHMIHYQQSSSTQSHIDESNNGFEVYQPRMRNIATETVVNKSIQTSSSLSEAPIIKPMWNTKNVNEKETKKNVSYLAKDKYCPCCGLPEKQSYSSKKQNHSETIKVIGTKTKHFHEGREENNKLVCNASVQASVKEPLAYLLTFEPTCQENTKLQKRDSLPEIKLLVPISESNLENEVRRKISATDSFKENQCPSEEDMHSLPVLDAHDQSIQAEEREKNKKKQKLTLQEYLRANRPDYIQHADKRTQCLADLALLRDLRKEKRLELMTMADKQQIENRDELQDERIICSGALLSGKSKVTSRTMREQSRRKYHKTREVQNRLTEKKKKEDFRTNRFMAELFTKKLQKKVLQGVVNHSNTASVTSSVP